MRTSTAFSQDFSELDRLKYVRIYFCYSSEMDEDIDRLQILIRDKCRTSFPSLDVDYRNWRNERVFQLEPQYIEFQDYLNESILLSDYVVFLMWHKPGPHTIEEFKLCCGKTTPRVILGVRDNDNAFVSLRQEISEIQRVRAYPYLDIETVAFNVCTELGNRHNTYIEKLDELSSEIAYAKGVTDTLWRKVDKRRVDAGMIPLSAFIQQITMSDAHSIKQLTIANSKTIHKQTDAISNATIKASGEK